MQLALGRTRGKFGYMPVNNPIRNIERPAAHFAVLEIRLAGDRAIQEHRDILATIRAHEMILLQSLALLD